MSKLRKKSYSLISAFKFDGCFSISFKTNMDFQDQKRPKDLRITYSTRVCF